MNDTAKMVAVGAGVALVGVIVIYVVGRKVAGAAGDAAKAVGEAVNPVSNENIFYKGVQAVVGSVAAPETKPEEFSFGAWLFEKLNPGAVAKENAVLSGTQESGSPYTITP